jgi:hypothetical protein
MIPVSCKESIEYKDEDGIVWKFAPRYGALEREFIQLSDTVIGKPILEQLALMDSFFDKILIGWKDEKGRMRPFPSDKKPSAILNQNEKTRVVFRYWIEANKLTPEEKKS